MKLILCTTFVLLALSHSTYAATAKCETYQTRINQLQNLNAKGGKATSIEARRQRINQYEAALFHCGRHQTIAITSGNHPKPFKATPQQLRHTNSQNPQVQQLTNTCNYWITENKASPSWDNTNFRDTACRAADESAAAITHSPPMAAYVRKLKDCMKPNNTIDNEVNECMQGSREANW
jgi:hypothetical protein